MCSLYNVQLDDFKFLESIRDWLKDPREESEIRARLRSAIRTEKSTPGLKSLILGGYPIEKILIYPYKEYPPMRHIMIAPFTLGSLNQAIADLEWSFTVDKNGLHLEVVGKDRRDQIYAACMRDENTRDFLTAYKLDLPITQTNSLQITLCRIADLEKMNRQIMLTKVPQVSATGVSIGFSFDHVKFTWFMCVDINVDSQDRNKFQKNLHFTIASMPR